MKKLLIYTVGTFLLVSCGDNFLDNEPTIGLTADKLTDIQSMQALIYGAYGTARPFISQSALYSAGMMRDVLNRNRGEYDPFYSHQISTTMTSWQYTSGYQTLGLLNQVYVSDLENMEGSDDQKNSIKGDMHFLRALVYFELNNFWTKPSTGYSVPLVLKPLTPDDRVETATAQQVRDQIELDIEAARTYFETTSGESDYYAATALAARVYFYHEKYDLAYDRANEVILDGGYALETDVSAPFVPPGNSSENIFTFKFNAGDGSGVSPTARIFEAYQPDPARGFYSMNPEGSAASMIMNTDDARFNAFYTEESPFIYVDGKYTTEQMHYLYIRLAEMYLIRAEANIMVSNSVVQQDVDDINMIINRAYPANVLVATPTVQDALDLIFEERTKELAFELGDHFLNTKRLQKGIIQIDAEGTGEKPYSEWSELLVYPFPDIEVDIHGLTRDR